MCWCNEQETPGKSAEYLKSEPKLPETIIGEFYVLTVIGWEPDCFVVECTAEPKPLRPGVLPIYRLNFHERLVANEWYLMTFAYKPKSIGTGPNGEAIYVGTIHDTQSL